MTSNLQQSGQMWPTDGLVQWALETYVARTGRELTQPEFIRATPWSSVIRWSDGDSFVFGKAVCPGFAHEAKLLPILAARIPDRVLAPIATDFQNGWMLLPDGGNTLDGAVDVATWEQALLGYAEIQRAFSGSIEVLLEAGCPDMRPAAAVSRLERMMDSGSVPSHPRLVDAAWSVAARIDTDMIPVTIQHDDLRPDNVFASGRIFDWGDANLSHPFGSLLTALMPNRPNRPGTTAEKLTIRDKYLDGWQRAFPDSNAPAPSLEELRGQADLVVKIGPIARIDTWLRAPDAALLAYPGAIDRWVELLLATAWP